MFLKSDPSAVSWYCSSSEQSIKHRHTLYPALPMAVQALSTVNFLLLWKQIISPWRDCWSFVLGCPIQDVGSKATSPCRDAKGGLSEPVWMHSPAGEQDPGSEEPPAPATRPAEFCAPENTAWPWAHLLTPTSHESSGSTTGKKDCDAFIRWNRKPSKLLPSPWMLMPCSFLHLPLPLAGSNLHSLPISLLWDKFLGLSRASHFSPGLNTLLPHLVYSGS